jgi:hypothetical protein
MLRHAHFYIKGGLQTFAASANHPHPAGVEADIQATLNWAWRCAAASLLRAHSHELNQQDECQLWQILDVGQFNSHQVNSASPAKANNIKKLSTTQISEIPCIFLKLCRLDIMRLGYGSVTKV